MPNPLLNTKAKPTFTDIIPGEHIESALHTLFTEYRGTLATCLQQTEFTWQNLFAPLNAVDVKIENMWTAVSQLNDNVQTDELRDIHDHCDEELDAFNLENLQNAEFFTAVKVIAASPAFDALTREQQRDVELKLQAFEGGGISLSKEEQAELIEIEKALSEATNQFESNLLDATDNWSHHVTNPLDLQGLPDSFQQKAAALAKEQGKEGWVLILDTSLVLSGLKYLDNRALRKVLYHGYNTRASEVNPGTEQWNNLPLIETILRLRHRKAQLLGHPNYASLALVNKMAKTPGTALDFLTKLADKARLPAKKELAEIQQLAKMDGMTDFAPWDIAYYAEKLRKQKYNFSEEEIKPYFPLETVLQGYFSLLNTLYGITLQEAKPEDTWHPDVRYFDIYDEDKQLRGGVYVDFYSRPKKLDGAWMTEGRSRVILPDGSLQLPIAFLSTDFSKTTDKKPSLLNLTNVQTLFHEFGHCLHQVMTQMSVKSVAGIFGVPEDGIEFPSQIMEYFVQNPAVIRLISSHYETKEPLPTDLLESILAAKHFQTAMTTIKYVQLALLDMRLHWEYDPLKGARTLELLTEIQQHYAPMIPPAEDNRYPCQFSHIFGNDYAAGYYNYQWAEVLACDAYSRFDAAGTLSAKVGREFMHCILEQGGTPDFMQAYVAFRGREPRMEAFMHYNGLEEKMPALSAGGTVVAPVMFRPAKRKAEEQLGREVMEAVAETKEVPLNSPR